MHIRMSKRKSERDAHVATAVGELEGHEVGLVVLREGLRGGGLVHRVVPQQSAHICRRAPRIRAESNIEADCTRRRGRKRGMGGGLPLAT